MAKHFLITETDEPIVLTVEQTTMLVHLLDEYKKHMDEAHSEAPPASEPVASEQVET